MIVYGVDLGRLSLSVCFLSFFFGRAFYKIVFYGYSRYLGRRFGSSRCRRKYYAFFFYVEEA